MLIALLYADVRLGQPLETQGSRRSTLRSPNGAELSFIPCAASGFS